MAGNSGEAWGRLTRLSINCRPRRGANSRASRPANAVAQQSPLANPLQLVDNLPVVVDQFVGGQRRAMSSGPVMYSRQASSCSWVMLLSRRDLVLQLVLVPATLTWTVSRPFSW